MATRVYRHVRGTEDNYPILTFVAPRFVNLERPAEELYHLLDCDSALPDVVYFDQHGNVLDALELANMVHWALKGRNRPKAGEKKERWLPRHLRGTDRRPQHSRAR